MTFGQVTSGVDVGLDNVKTTLRAPPTYRFVRSLCAELSPAGVAVGEKKARDLSSFTKFNRGASADIVNADQEPHE